MVNIMKYGQLFGKGLTATLAPSIMKGALVEMFRAKRVDASIATEWVLANNSIWDSLDPDRKRRFKELASKLGDISWMSADWAIGALKDDFPAVASLFLGWKKGRNWLTRQIEIIKKELQE